MKATIAQVREASLTIDTLLQMEDLLDERKPVCLHLEEALREVQAACEKARDIAGRIIENAGMGEEVK